MTSKRHVVIDRGVIARLALIPSILAQFPALARYATSTKSGCTSCGQRTQAAATPEKDAAAAEKEAKKSIVNASPENKALILAVLNAKSADILAPGPAGKSVWHKLS